MSWFYRIGYAIGFKPWEAASTREAALIAALFDREEREREPPYGPALDCGCGTGMQAVALARRGWQVTGVEIVPTALRAAGIGTGFRFVMDFGLFHGLKDEERTAMGPEVSALTNPDATTVACRRFSRG